MSGVDYSGIGGDWYQGEGGCYERCDCKNTKTKITYLVIKKMVTIVTGMGRNPND